MFFSKMASGIKELASIIEKIKKKKLSSAIIEYQEYSKFPELKSKKYIEALEERILKEVVGG